MMHHGSMIVVIKNLWLLIRTLILHVGLSLILSKVQFSCKLTSFQRLLVDYLDYWSLLLQIRDNL